MELYLTTAQASSRLFTNAYSSSFGMASRLFSKPIRQHIYNIYGLTRIADEIVDTYKGDGAGTILDELERETYQAMERQYSANPIVHAFQATARQFGITKTLLKPFFASMRSDLTKQAFTQVEYERYIHGSAEVVGLMCLRVFCNGSDEQYSQLANGATKLGSAYQKVNFLRDLAADHAELNRCYFPGVTFESFDETAKQAIITDIRADFAEASPTISELPAGARRAVRASYRYYMALLDKLEHTSASTIKIRRVRISNARKLSLLV
jgi:15-cis-phytoene synthase